MKATLGRLVIAWAFAAGLLVSWNVSQVSAACNPGRSSGGGYSWAFVGYTPSAAIRGASSMIWNYAPYVPSGFSYSWVMLTSPTPSTWAQIGNYESPTSRFVYAQQWNTSTGGWAQRSWPAQPVNSYTYYRVLYDPYTPMFTYQIGDTVVWQQVNPPWMPTGAQFASETTSLPVQMMGAAQNTVDFFNNTVSYSGAWHSVPGTPYVSPGGRTGYFGVGGNGANFWTWDRQCTGT